MNIYKFDDTILVAALEAKSARQFMAIVKDDYSYLYSKLKPTKKLKAVEIENIIINPDDGVISHPKSLKEVLDDKIDFDTELIAEGNWEET